MFFICYVVSCFSCYLLFVLLFLMYCFLVFIVSYYHFLLCFDCSFLLHQAPRSSSLQERSWRCDSFASVSPLLSFLRSGTSSDQCKIIYLNRIERIPTSAVVVLCFVEARHHFALRVFWVAKGPKETLALR